MTALGNEHFDGGRCATEKSQSKSPPQISSTDWTNSTNMIQYEEWLCQFEKEGMPAEVVKQLMEGMRPRKSTSPDVSSLNNEGTKRPDKHWGTLSSFMERDGTRQLAPFGDSTSTNHSSYLGENSAHDGSGIINTNKDNMLECEDEEASTNMRNGDAMSKGLVYPDINRLRTMGSMEQLNGWMRGNGNTFDNYPRSFHPPQMNNSVAQRRQTPSARSAINTPNGFYSGSMTPRPSNNNNSQHIDTYSNYVPPDLDYLVVNHRGGDDSISVRRSSQGARSSLDNGRLDVVADNVVEMQRRIDQLQHQVEAQESLVTFLTGAISRLYPQIMEEYKSIPIEVLNSQAQNNASSLNATGGWNDLGGGAGAPASSAGSIYGNMMSGLGGGNYFTHNHTPLMNSGGNGAYNTALTTAASSSSGTNNQHGGGNNMGSLTRNGVQIPKNSNGNGNSNNDPKSISSRIRNNFTNGGGNVCTTPTNNNNNSNKNNNNSKRRQDHSQHHQQQPAMSLTGICGDNMRDPNANNNVLIFNNNPNGFETDHERNKREIASLELAENNKVVIHVKTDNFNELQVREEMHMRCPGITDEIIDVNVYDKSKTLILTYHDGRSAQTASQTLQGHLRKIAHTGSAPSDLIKSVGISKPPIIRDLRAYSQRIKERYVQFPIVVYAEMPVLGKVFPEGRKQLHSYRLEWAAEAKRRTFDMKGNNGGGGEYQGFDQRKDAVIVFMSRDPGGVFECYLEEMESRQIKQKLMDNDQWPTLVK